MSRKRPASDDHPTASSAKHVPLFFIDSVESSVDHFSRLPVEILEYLLTFSGNLKECSLLNKKCNDIISSSRKLMNRFKMGVFGNSKQNFEEIATFGRRFRKIQIWQLQSDQTETVTAGLRDVGCNLTEVKTVGCFVNENFLSCFPNVAKLEITFGFFGKTRTKVLNPSLLPKLKHLKLISVDNLSIFAKITDLNTLDVDCGEKGPNTMVKQLENLRTLDTLRLTFKMRRNPNLNLHPDLRIRRLFICDKNDSDAEDLILKFSDKVECIYYLGTLSEFQVQNLLQRCSSIKALSVNTLPISKNFYQKAKVNTKLTELVVNGKICYTALVGAFTIFPNLKKLSIFLVDFENHLWTPESINHLNRKLNQLEMFTVAISNGRNVSIMNHFQNVTALYMQLHGILGFSTNFSSVFSPSSPLKDSCRNSSFLSIQKCGNCNVTINLDQIIQIFPKLTSLQLDKCFYKLKSSFSIMNAIKEKGKNLKSLMLEEATKDFLDVLYQDARNFGVEGLYITSFDDKTKFEIVNKGGFKFDD